MANDENLIPAKPGEVRNPNGRGKGVKNRSTILREFLELRAKGLDLKNFKDADLPNGMTIEQAMAMKVLDLAMQGDIAAFKEIQDTIYGKLTDKVDTRHSFTQMGRVKAEPIEGQEAVALSFDVGKAPPEPEQED